MLPVLVMTFGVIAFGVGAVWYYIEHPRVATPALVGGRGGNAAVEGHRSGAQGGDAGESGLWPGGPGGDAFVKGNDSFARGGDGSNAPQADGRGGRRSRGPGEKLNLPTMTWSFGYGGHGADTPEYARRLKLLTQIRAEYIAKFPDDVPYIEAGIDPVPENWVNKRLEEMGETWRVTLGDGRVLGRGPAAAVGGRGNPRCFRVPRFSRGSCAGQVRHRTDCAPRVQPHSSEASYSGAVDRG